MADDQPYQMESATSIVVIVLIVLVIIGIIILMVAWFNSSNAPTTTTTQNKEIGEDDDDDDAGTSIAPAPRLGSSRNVGPTGCGPCGAKAQKDAAHNGIHVTGSQHNMDNIPILMVNDDDEDESDASDDHRPHSVDIKTPSDGSVINLMLSDRSEVHIHVSDKSAPVRRLISDMPSDQSEQFSLDNLPSVEFGSVETTSVDRYPKSSPRSGRSPPAVVSPASPSSRLSAGPTGVLNQMVEHSIEMPQNLPIIPVVGASRIDEISGESMDGSLSDPANFSSDFSSQTDMSIHPVQKSKIRIPAPPAKVPANLKMGPLSSGDI